MKGKTEGRRKVRRKGSKLKRKGREGRIKWMRGREEVQCEIINVGGKVRETGKKGQRRSGKVDRRKEEG